MRKIEAKINMLDAMNSKAETVSFQLKKQFYRKKAENQNKH